MATIYGIIAPYIDDQDNYIVQDYYKEGIRVTATVTVSGEDQDLATILIVAATGATVQGSATFAGRATVQAQSTVTSTAVKTVTGSITISGQCSVTTSAALTLGGSLTIEAQHQITAIPKLTLGAQSTINLGSVTVVTGEDYDFATVTINSSSQVTLTANSISDPGATVEIVSAVITDPYATFSGAVISAGTLGIDVRGNQIHDVIRDPYQLESGETYSWDSVGNNHDWDDWPQSIWGNVTGVHIPVRSQTQWQGGYDASGIINIGATSTVEAVTPSLYKGGNSTIESTSIVTPYGGFLIDADSTIDIDSTVSARSGLLFDVGATVDNQSSVSAIPTLTLSTTVAISGQTQLTGSGNFIFQVPALVEAELGISAFANGTMSAIGNITLGTVVLTVGRITAFDYYRAHLVDSETRTIMVLEDSRTHRVPSQTRIYRIPLPIKIGLKNRRINQ